jgi:hypothetical protein
MRTFLLALAAAVVILDGYVHGLWTNRWKTSVELEQAVTRLDRVPMTVGDWRGRALTLGAREVEVAEFAGYLHRQYQRPDGSTVTVLLACGRPGPLSVHTPDICYGGAGFAEAEPAVKHAAQGGQLAPPAEFWKGKFSKQDALVPAHMRVLWSWHAQGAWQAADRPRWSFAGLPVLHKMYVTCPLTSGDDRQEDAVCAEFLAVFLPELEKALFTKP